MQQVDQILFPRWLVPVDESRSVLEEHGVAITADEIVDLGPRQELPLSPAELRGRDIYAREGCAYCHTQQIRYTDADMNRFGAPTLAWEGRSDYPHMLGTRRIGPDLSRAGGTRSQQWQFAHLYAPRSVVPQSVMPGYPHFFDGSPQRPRRAPSRRPRQAPSRVC